MTHEVLPHGVTLLTQWPCVTFRHVSCVTKYPCAGERLLYKESTMNILITTLGTSWQVVPELYGFTNPDQLPLYANSTNASEIEELRTEYAVCPVDQVWVVTTNGERLQAGLAQMRQWAKALRVELRELTLPDLVDLTNASEINLMTDLIYRAVLHAHEASAGGKVYLSLAGGRKTMSADIQQAGNIFGCDAMFHVTDAGNLTKEFIKAGHEHFTQELPEKWADIVFPHVTESALPVSPILKTEEPVKANDYPLETKENSELADKIRSRVKNAGALLTNYRRQLIGDEATNFRGLYALDPEVIATLQGTRIKGTAEDEVWIRSLPKAELHCHFGGILSSEEMIMVAQEEAEQVASYTQNNSDFSAWINRLRQAVDLEDMVFLQKEMGESGKSLRQRFDSLPEPFGVCGFLLQFKDRVDMLDELIFADLLHENNFCGIGIDRYEKLGDLQGSGLMQSERCIRRACQVLIRQCQRENVTYCEIRCSPCNYTRGGLSSEQVVEAMIDELKSAPNTHFCLIFIASRHGSLEGIKAHVKLAEQLLDQDRDFINRFAGFDLAGAESAKQPEDLRQLFLPLMKRCLSLTIHAGEGESVENIWQAVYHLNADRIGHGLTLPDKPELMQRFIDRKVTVELCPSSNFQIVGFADSAVQGSRNYADYPMSKLLNAGVRVTINTDDPGISRTNLTREFIKASTMTPKGLTRWQVLQLIRNSFRAAFVGQETRRNCLLKAEDEIIQILV